MTTPKFVQIHTLTSYPATLLNRDDAGFAKRLPFGGATRTRVSSQCLKYHWRHFEGENALYYEEEIPKSVRSRRTFRKLIAEPLIDQGGYPQDLVVAATASLKALLLAENKHLDSNDKLKKSSFNKFVDVLAQDDDDDPLDTGQITILGSPEIDYIKKVIRNEIDEFLQEHVGYSSESRTSDQENDFFSRMKEYFKSRGKRAEIKKTLKGLETAAGLDAAMFGRMTTSDVLARGDAAVHVAHAFTTHTEETESDYFLAADELKSDTGELGGGHINSAELTSGLFYSYQVIDVPLLVSNLTGDSRDEWQNTDRDLAGEVVRRMIHLITKVSPGAKLGSTAPYSRAQCLFVEAGAAQPRTLANAFQNPASRENVLEDSFRKLGNYVSEMDAMYGVDTERRLAAMGDAGGLADAVKVEQTHSVPEIAEWAANLIRE